MATQTARYYSEGGRATKRQKTESEGGMATVRQIFADILSDNLSETSSDIALVRQLAETALVSEPANQTIELQHAGFFHREHHKNTNMIKSDDYEGNVCRISVYFSRHTYIVIYC